MGRVALPHGPRCRLAHYSRPSPTLRPFIDRYVGYRLTGLRCGGPPRTAFTPHDVHRQHRTEHRRRVPDRSGSGTGQSGCVLGGLQARPALIERTGHQEGVAIELTPLGCRALFGIPSRALWNTSLECSDVAGAAGEECGNGCSPRGLDGGSSFATCDDMLTGLATPTSSWPRNSATHGGRSSEQAGQRPITALATDLGWTRQHLARRFGDEFGPSPRSSRPGSCASNGREAMLQATPPFVTIAQVAAACGYYDQAHLDRDFAELAGCPPTTWLAEERFHPSKTDTAAARDRRNMPRRPPTALSGRCSPTATLPPLSTSWPTPSASEKPARYTRESTTRRSSSTPSCGGHSAAESCSAPPAKDDTPFGQRVPGNDRVYVVCEAPDALFERVMAAGAEVVRGFQDEDYGSRGFTAVTPREPLEFRDLRRGVMAPAIAHGSLGLVHLAVGDADHAMAFYGDLFGWVASALSPRP